MHNIYYQGLSGERSLPLGLLVSETNAASDLKVGRCRQVIEVMKVCEY